MSGRIKTNSYNFTKLMLNQISSIDKSEFNSNFTISTVKSLKLSERCGARFNLIGLMTSSKD